MRLRPEFVADPAGRRDAAGFDHVEQRRRGPVGLDEHNQIRLAGSQRCFEPMHEMLFERCRPAQLGEAYTHGGQGRMAVQGKNPGRGAGVLEAVACIFQPLNDASRLAYE